MLTCCSPQEEELDSCKTDEEPVDTMVKSSKRELSVLIEDCALSLYEEQQILGSMVGTQRLSGLSKELRKHPFSRPTDLVGMTRNMEFGSLDDLQTNPLVDGKVVEISCKLGPDLTAIPFDP